jgi:hypothetical protein
MYFYLCMLNIRFIFAEQINPMIMKTFKHLEFLKHPVSISNGTQARLFFDNGYGVSVISGSIFYTDLLHPYELAILKGSESNCSLCYSTPITDDVCGHLNRRQVTDLMKKVQLLK